MEEQNIKNLKFGLKEEYLNRMIGCFKENSNIEKVVIYGSRAKGNYKRFSDIDISLIGPKLTHTDLFNLFNDLDDLLLPYEIDLSILSEIDNPNLLKEIEEFGQPLYQQSQLR
ncbi:MAG: nucleotidyltransferase domain-containing protein [Muribaculaceae bacterium]|nr:nucleotidyltransferase domain-containing protein [Muribaculaceae bacterium]MDE6753832.1 nucleotidyltransferase domain-containing protein [Muribaculaceae bacterium]